MTDRPTFGSLFSGIGGIDLGMERAGFECLWQSEIEPYACRVLKKHWPDVPNLGDIRDIDWTGIRTPDVVAGGYPCQPFSHAGVRRGEADPRHLWPMFAECIRVLRPRYALLENVSGHLSLGFGSVLADLAALGYDARWDCIPAAAVGAPHLRDRVFVIARDTRTQQRRHVAYSDDRGSFDAFRSGWHAPWDGSAFVADPAGASSERGSIPSGGQTRQSRFDVGGCEWPSPFADTAERGRPGPGRAEHSCDTTATSQREADQPVDDCYWKTEPDVGRVANGVPNGVDRLRGLGNAVVPQVAEHVARIIMNDLRYRNDRNGTALLGGHK